jgi:hypothetical protein
MNAKQVAGRGEKSMERMIQNQIKMITAEFIKGVIQNLKLKTSTLACACLPEPLRKFLLFTVARFDL